MKSYVLKVAAVCAGCLSVAVVWSEVTFFNKSPVLSLFAQFLNLAKRNYDYFTIEVSLFKARFARSSSASPFVPFFFIIDGIKKGIY